MNTKLSSKRIKGRIRRLKDGSYTVELNVLEMTSYDLLFGMTSLATFIMDKVRKEFQDGRKREKILTTTQRIALGYSKTLAHFTRGVMDAVQKSQI
jgi:hypothetical protein